jgi:hypothetical protein
MKYISRHPARDHPAEQMGTPMFRWPLICIRVKRMERARARWTLTTQQTYWSRRWVTYTCVLMWMDWKSGSYLPAESITLSAKVGGNGLRELATRTGKVAKMFALETGRTLARCSLGIEERY